MNDLKHLIDEQINKTNASISGYWGRSYFNGFMSEDPAKLKAVLGKINRYYHFFYILSVTLSAFLITLSMLKYFGLTDFGNMDKSGLIILLTIAFIVNVYRFYKVKVNLEHKIFLLKVLENINTTPLKPK
ncbi:MAG TPA: hypothetical protein VE870_17645 [Bacteroidales bacterium]|nr:hypothetical protein [Bacteroidales bacterium]